MPAANSSDDIVMRLILKGQEPAEAARLARLPIDAVRAEYAAGAQKIQEAFQKSYEAQTKESQKAAKEEIRLQQDKTRQIVRALNEIEKEQARAAKGISMNWRRTMEDLENLTTVTRGAWDALMGGASKLKGLGDEAARVTNIYGSLKGSIDKMREASGGQIADIDLITTKNRAVQKELALTDDQFAMVAAGADIFADALGTDTKEALDQLIDGLATGRTKMLASAGVVVDTEKAYEAYAKKVHVSTDRLSEHEKKVATVEASLRALDKKIIESGAGVETFADQWERANAQIDNTKNEWLIAAGEMGSSITTLFLKTIPEAITGTILRLDIVIAKFKDAMTFGKAGYGADVKQKENLLNGFLQNLVDEDMAAKGAASKKVAEAQARQALDRSGKGNPYGADKAVGGGTKPGGKDKAPTYEYTGIDRLLAVADQLAANQRATDLAADSKAQELQDLLEKYDATHAGGGAATMVARASKISPGGTLNEEDTKAFIAAQGKAAFSRLSYGQTGGVLIGDNYKQAGRGDAGVSLKDAKGSANLDEDFIKNLESEIKASREKAGGGILGQILFGDDTSLDQTYDRLSKAKQFAIDNFAEIESAGHQMAGALGQSLAAAIGENKNFKEAMKAATHAVLMGLSQQAFVKSAMATAEGILALTNPVTAPTAPGYFLAAAAFAGVGTLAGLGARATYSAPSTGSTPTSVRGSSAGVGGGSRSSGGGGGDTTIVFNINGMIGDSQDVIREIGRGMDEYRRKNSRYPFGDN